MTLAAEQAVVRGLHMSAIQPDIGIRRQKISNPKFLKEFIKNNHEHCSYGSTNKRITNILNIGYSGSTVGFDEFREFIKTEVNPLIEKYRTDYSIEPLREETSWLLLKYDKGHFFNSHIDDGYGFPRTVSVVIFASDDYTGGELIFDKFNLTFKPNFGEILIFPSSYPFAHTVRPVTDGTKYSFVNWYTFSGESHGALC